MVQNDDLDGASPAMVGLLLMPLVFVLWVVLNPGGDSVLAWFGNIALCLTALAATFACLLAARRYSGNGVANPWGLIFAGMAFMTFGESAWLIQEMVLGQEVGSPAVADIGYLVFYPFLFVGLFMMPHAPTTPGRRITLGLDIAIATGAVTLIVAHFLLSRLIDGDGTPASTLITIAYPVSDLALIFAALVLVVRAGPNLSRTTMMLLALGFIAIAVSDSLYAYLMETDVYTSGNLIDTGWVFGYALVGAAALTAAGRTLNIDHMKDEEPKSSPAWQTLALHVMIIPVLVILFLERDGADLTVSVAFMTGFIFLTMLLFLRQFSAHMEHALVARHLRESNDSLQRALQVERMRRLAGIEVDTGEKTA